MSTQGHSVRKYLADVPAVANLQLVHPQNLSKQPSHKKLKPIPGASTITGLPAMMTLRVRRGRRWYEIAVLVTQEEDGLVLMTIDPSTNGWSAEHAVMNLTEGDIVRAWKRWELVKPTVRASHKNLAVEPRRD